MSDNTATTEDQGATSAWWKIFEFKPGVAFHQKFMLWALLLPVLPFLFTFRCLAIFWHHFAALKIFHPKELWIYTWRVQIPYVVIIGLQIALWRGAVKGPHYATMWSIGLCCGIMLMNMINIGQRRFMKRLDALKEQGAEMARIDDTNLARIEAIDLYIETCRKQNVNPTMENLQEFQKGQRLAYRDQQARFLAQLKIIIRRIDNA